MSGDPRGVAPGTVTAVRYVRNTQLSLTDVIVLDLVDDVDQADLPYCVHGRATCAGGCGRWLWLGDQSHGLVTAGTAPLCRPCAHRLIPPGQPVADNAGDHRRSEGPHT